MEAEFCNTFDKSMEAEFCNTFDKSIERVRQYCLYFLDDTPDLPVECTDEEFTAYFIKKYPLLNHAGLSNWKTECFDMADALFDIKHPQFNEISGLLYSSIFISDSYQKNKIIAFYIFIKSIS